MIHKYQVEIRVEIFIVGIAYPLGPFICCFRSNAIDTDILWMALHILSHSNFPVLPSFPHTPLPSLLMFSRHYFLPVQLLKNNCWSFLLQFYHQS